MNLALFDIDGTITDTYEVDTECFFGMVEQRLSHLKLDRNWDSYRYATDIGVIMEAYERAGDLSLNIEKLRDLEDEFLRRLRTAFDADFSRFKPVDGVMEMLSRLNSSSYWRVAFATGGFFRTAAFKLHKIDIDQNSIPIASSYDGLSREEVIVSAISRAKVFYLCHKFERVIYIGDGIWDFRAAQNLGIPFIAVARGSKRADFEKMGIKAIIENFSDLDGFLRLLETA